MENKPIWNKEMSRHEIDGIPFDGHFLEWKLEYSPKTYLKESELSGDEWRKGGAVKIYLNDDCVLSEFCRSPERAMLLLAKGLHELQCHFELFGVDIKSWKEDLIGKKVHHGGIPSTIISYCGDGEIIVERDDGKPYRPDLYPSLVNDDEDEWGSHDRVHITDKRINWHITPYKD
jgi:hypothetical protein